MNLAQEMATNTTNITNITNITNTTNTTTMTNPMMNLVLGMAMTMNPVAMTSANMTTMADHATFCLHPTIKWQ